MHIMRGRRRCGGLEEVRVDRRKQCGGANMGKEQQELVNVHSERLR
jgi:hypothetical protein